MNSDLPSLLDAIFGKKDITSVSLEEVYEVITEFPSFNAAHFLLSKKLKSQNGDEYEKENQRTALYFNNAFWLQTLLNDNSNSAKDLSPEIDVEDNKTVSQVHEPSEAPQFPANADELDVEEVEILEEKYDADLITSDHVRSENEMDAGEKSVSDVYLSGETEAGENINDKPVSSFDDLLSKYGIHEQPSGSEDQVVPETDIKAVYEKEIIISAPDSVYGSVTDSGYPVQDPENQLQETGTVPEIPTVSNKSEQQSEHTGEILNEYGIFEEEIDENPDYDLEAFDRPIDQQPIQTLSAPIIIPVGQSGDIESIAEITPPQGEPDKQYDGDNEAFDRPDTESGEHAGIPELNADQTDFTAVESDAFPEDQMPELSARFSEQQKSLPVFDAKSAESIVFAPYHMIDYFASQGIKLVLDDQPSDNFGKQLKSFTDWLKVMKRLPAQPVSEKADDQEADRIRHFAAHSIEGKDILTESMAEVLAKQGMYENAIALYQKLSLIYPPKSAYFASRIEQLKASLP